MYYPRLLDAFANCKYSSFSLIWLILKANISFTDNFALEIKLSIYLHLNGYLIITHCNDKLSTHTYAERDRQRENEE